MDRARRGKPERSAVVRAPRDIATAELDAAKATIFLGELAGARSPARAYSPIVGAEIVSDCGGPLRIPVEPAFEHALLVIAGSLAMGAVNLSPETLYYVAPGVEIIGGEIAQGSRALLIGGAPFGEPVLRNFVARTADEIAAAREDWERGRRFGAVANYHGPRLSAPPLALRPRATEPRRGLRERR